MARVWAWLKKNWKWLILPLWVLSMLAMWLISGGHAKLFPPSGTTDAAADSALKAKDEAMAAFRVRLDELYKKAEERLKTASEEQVKEFTEVKGKSLEEVAKWIDSLS